MEDSTILFNICIYATIPVLRKLADSGFWSVMQEFIYSEFFWYCRVRIMMYHHHNTVNVTWYPEGQWKRTYHGIGNPEIRFGNLTHMRMLLELGFITDFRDLVDIASGGNVDVLNLLLDRGWKSPPMHRIISAIVVAAARGRIGMYSRLVREYPDIPSEAITRSLCAAMEEGRIAIINLILCTQRIDLSDYRTSQLIHQSIYYVCTTDNLEVMRELSTRIIINPDNTDIGRALVYLCNKGRTEMMKILLSFPEFKMSAHTLTLLLDIADQNESSGIIDLLQEYVGE